jgi:hypothetical protein
MDEHRTAPLSPRQRDVLRLLQAIMRAAPDRPPSVPYLAAKLHVHHSVVQDHLSALFRKGWLCSPTPSGLRCTHAPR